MPWQPGQSGNPGGRPKTKKLADLLDVELSKPAGKGQQTKEQRMLQRLVGIALTGKPGNAIRAVQMILAYRYGQPTQTIELEVRQAAEQFAARTGADPDWLVRRAQEIAQAAGAETADV